MHLLGSSGFSGDSSRAQYNVSLGVFKFYLSFLIHKVVFVDFLLLCLFVFLSFQLDCLWLLLVFSFVCFFPAMFSALEMHKVISIPKWQWQFWDVKVISQGGIKCIKVLACRTEHPPQIFPRVIAETGTISLFVREVEMEKANGELTSNRRGAHLGHRFPSPRDAWSYWPTSTFNTCRRDRVEGDS